MKTERVYQKDVYMKECAARIISCEPTDGGILLEFDKTIFFPTGGGQSCDTGFIYILGDENSKAKNTADTKIAAFEIVSVFEDGKRVMHRAIPLYDNCPAAEAADVSARSASLNLADIGMRVLQKIDWERRFDNMQRHCGEHILSGMFYSKFGGVNRGFHMGEAYMTIDISLEKNPAYNTLTWDMAKEAELAANEVIWNDRQITTHRFKTREEASAMPLRKALTIDEDISIVCIGSIENASDCVACCGTHPSSAGQVGLIKIWKIEPNKGMFRIYCEAGRRAYLDYEKKHDIITAMENKYSAGTDDLEEKMAIADEKAKAVRMELAAMRKIVIDSRTADIENERQQDGHSSPLIVRRYNDIKPDDLLHIGKPFIGSIGKLLVLADTNSNTVMLFSDGKRFDCGRLIKENAPIYNGKGGGRADNARAIFPNAEYLETFIDLLDKHLR